MTRPRKFSIINGSADELMLSDHRASGIAVINPKGLGIGFTNTLEDFNTNQIVKNKRVKLPDFEVDLLLGLNWSNATPRQLYMQIIKFLNNPPYTLKYVTENGEFKKDIELLDLPMSDIKESQTIQETIKFSQLSLWYQELTFKGKDPEQPRTDKDGKILRDGAKLAATDPQKLGRAYNIAGADYTPGGGTGLNLLDGTRDFSGNWGNSENWVTDGTYEGLTVKKRTGQFGGLFKAFTAPKDGVYAFSAYIKSANSNDVWRWVNVNNVDISNSILGSNFGWKRDILTLELKAGDVAFIRYEFQAPGTSSTLWTAGHKWESGSTATPWTQSESEMKAANGVGYVYSSNIGANGTGGVFDLHNDSIYFGLQSESPLEIIIKGPATGAYKSPFWEIVGPDGKVISTDAYNLDVVAGQQLVIRGGFGKNRARVQDIATGIDIDAYQKQDHSKTNFVNVPLGDSQLRFHTADNTEYAAGDILITMRKEYMAVG